MRWLRNILTALVLVVATGSVACAADESAEEINVGDILFGHIV